MKTLKGALVAMLPVALGIIVGLVVKEQLVDKYIIKK
jgi:hypothetical protein